SGWPDQDLAAFKAAKTADDYTVLNTRLQTQVSKLTVDSQPAALAKVAAAAVLARFQDDVTTYTTEAQANNGFLATQRKLYPNNPDYNAVWSLSNSTGGFGPPDGFFTDVPNFTVDPKYAAQAAQDGKTLDAAQTASDLSALEKTVAQQEQALAFPLLKVKTFYDINTTLLSLVNEGQSTTTDVTFAGTLYKTPNAYEYADGAVGLDQREHKSDTTAIQDAQVRLDQTVYLEAHPEANGYASDAQTNYQAVDDEAQMFIHNLSAMITNLAQMPKDNNARQAWSMTSHATDVSLVDYYGLQNTRVIVVSLREQKARLYENGKMVVGSDGQPYAFDVTSGSPDKPSVPGVHCALPPLKGPPAGDIYKSPDPPGSPLYYAPTPVHYSFSYSLYGYYMHDGWWRDATEMGYLTNLPHYDPEAFNGGSHGCVNFHYANGDMGKVYAFSNPGIPIIVY
ncbi:MAG TPA: L,D-transpeptidase, partial [Chloroflexota bacterium]